VCLRCEMEGWPRQRMTACYSTLQHATHSSAQRTSPCPTTDQRMPRHPRPPPLPTQPHPHTHPSHKAIELSVYALVGMA
jgi:hypothetical protein